jgi:hypothetical protein
MWRSLENRWLRYVAGPVILLVAAQLGFGALKLGLLVLGSALVMGGNLAADRSIRSAEQALRQEDARHALTLLLQNSVTFIEAFRPGSPERSLRANLMLFKQDRQGLQIEYSTSGYDPEEKGLLQVWLTVVVTDHAAWVHGGEKASSNSTGVSLPRAR